MATSSEPLHEVLARAERIVLADVVEAVRAELPRRMQAAAPPPGEELPLPEQRVRLRIHETLRGPAAREVTAIKPEGPYVLAAGHRGPYLLDGSAPTPRILGRFGPDTFPLAVLIEALQQRGAAPSAPPRPEDDLGGAS